MFFVAMVGMLGETIVHGASALANAMLRHRAAAIADAQFARAVESAQGAIAGAVSAGSDASKATMPSPRPTCVLATDSACAMETASTLAVATPAPRMPGGCPQTDCTAYLQNNAVVREGRIAVDIATSVSASSGAVLANRQERVSFRTFAAPPYATLAGTLDRTVDAIAPGGVGDDGGAPGSANGNDSTLVRVEYVNAAHPTAAPIPGNVWRADLQNPGNAPAPWDY